MALFCAYFPLFFPPLLRNAFSSSKVISAHDFEVFSFQKLFKAVHLCGCHLIPQYKVSICLCLLKYSTLMRIAANWLNYVVLKAYTFHNSLRCPQQKLHSLKHEGMVLLQNLFCFSPLFRRILQQKYVFHFHNGQRIFPSASTQLCLWSL